MFITYHQTKLRMVCSNGELVTANIPKDN